MVKTSYFMLANLLTLATQAYADDLTYPESGYEVLPLQQNNQQTPHRTTPIAQTIEQAFTNGDPIQVLQLGEEQPLAANSPQELQYLAKAARNIGQFEMANKYYRQLLQHPSVDNQKTGLLGLWLIETDQRHQAQAQQHAQTYQQRFGQDQNWKDASGYYQQVFLEAVPPTANSDKPDAKTQLLTDYRLAAKSKQFPQQQALLNQHPEAFTATDALWLELSRQQETISTNQSGSAQTNNNLLQAREQVRSILQQTPNNQDLQQAALISLMDASLRLDDPKQTILAYHQLQQIQPDIAYDTQVVYAMALLNDHQPRRALTVLQGIPKEQLSDDIKDRMIAAHADMGYMNQAKKLVKTWEVRPRVNDFTHNYQISNPYDKEKLFWDIRLTDWDGNHRKANHMVQDWLNQAPADTSAIRLKGDLKRWQGMPDSALAAYDEAAYYLHPDEQLPLESNKATVYLDQGNVKSARVAIQKLPDYSRNKADLLERLRLQDAPMLQVQSDFSNTTSPPQQDNEWGVHSKLYSARNQTGHRVYVEHEVEVSPHQNHALRMQRVGLGAEFNFYPSMVDLTAGRGTELNQNPYFNLAASHQFNQYTKASVEVQKNSETTPLRALDQGTYADAVLASINIHFASDVDAGVGLSVNDFDDGNLRREAYVFVSSTLWQHDRWSLKNYSRADWQRNKSIASAAYYNPEQANSIGTEFTAQYRHFFDNDIQLTHALTAGMGRNFQKDKETETTWVLRYGQNWDIKDRYTVGYNMGRKRAIYDGNPEYSNFVGFNTSIKF